MIEILAYYLRHKNSYFCKFHKFSVKLYNAFFIFNTQLCNELLTTIKIITMTNDVKEAGTGNRAMLTALFRDRESTENAYTAMRERGYTENEINLLMSAETRKNYYSDKNDESDLGNKAAETAGIGSAVGGTIGAIVGLITVIASSVAIPGIGLIVAGPLAAGLAGASAGGIAGAIIGVGIPEDRAKTYEAGIKEGNVVLGVYPKNEEDTDYLEQNWRTNRGEHIYR
jgi:hypothetical protein